MFKDISDYNNINDYLPILTAVLVVDIIGIILSYTNVITSKILRRWYKEFMLSAVLADVLIIFIGMIITRAIYHYVFDTFSIFKFILLALIIQITHDILFYLIISIIPRGTNKMVDIFKDYAKKVAYKAILGDSVMMIAISLLASYLANFDANTNIIIMVVFLYLLQYILYT